MWIQGMLFFNNCIEKNQNKTHFEEGSSSHTSLRDRPGYQNGKLNFRPFLDLVGPLWSFFSPLCFLNATFGLFLENFSWTKFAKLLCQSSIWRAPLCLSCYCSLMVVCVHCTTDQECWGYPIIHRLSRAPPENAVVRSWVRHRDRGRELFQLFLRRQLTEEKWGWGPSQS